jgi:hypothetical protein
MQPLYVVTMVSNPVRYKSRYRLYSEFREYMRRAGVTLLTVEVAFGDRPHEVTQAGDPWDVQLRTWDELWHKESAINAGVRHLSRQVPDWQYVAWVDADVTFARPDWAAETVQQLQHYQVVQMFSHAHDLGPDHAVFDTYPGFVWSYHQNLPREWGGQQYAGRKNNWHPGYAWAARREAFDALGGLMDEAILGSCDQHMACALIGEGRASINPKMHPNYLGVVDRWQARAEKYVRRDIGYVPGSLLHYWHGRKAQRGYLDRWKILRDAQFDPFFDLKADAQGLHQLVDHGDARSIRLRDQIRTYFRSRQEDGVEL